MVEGVIKLKCVVITCGCLHARCHVLVSMLYNWQHRGRLVSFLTPGGRNYPPAEGCSISRAGEDCTVDACLIVCQVCCIRGEFVYKRQLSGTCRIGGCRVMESGSASPHGNMPTVKTLTIYSSKLLRVLMDISRFSDNRAVLWLFLLLCVFSFFFVLFVCSQTLYWHQVPTVTH